MHVHNMYTYIHVCIHNICTHNFYVDMAQQKGHGPFRGDPDVWNERVAYTVSLVRTYGEVY